MSIKVIIADDKIVVDGLVSILKEENDIQVVGTALNGVQVLGLLEKHSVEIAILDIEMPEGPSGVELTGILQKKYPSVKVLILSMYKTKDFVTKIIQAGAKGYIIKNRGGEELVKAIRYIHQGQSYFGQGITDVLIEDILSSTPEKDKPSIKLTKREKEVLELIAKGRSSKQIAKELFIAASTVDTHRRNLIEKTGVSNSKELIRFAVEKKMV